jgi:hypothetical protein
MQITPALVAVALAAMVSAPAAPAPVDVAPAASVKFTNNTNGTATVRANGAVMFADVASGQTTDWANLSDSTVTFTMVTTVTEADSATVTQKVEEGARYALVGTIVEGKPVLSIAPSQTPAPAPGGSRR